MPPERRMKTFKIHLIRNGLAEGAAEGKYIGHTDVALTTQGKKQLRQMKERFEYPEVQAVLSAPLERCLETARILYPDRSPLVFDTLIEYDFGEFEGKTAEQLKDDPAFKEWLIGGPEAGAPHGETNAAFQKRVLQSFYEIVNGLIRSEADSVAVVTHGGVIMTLMQAFALPEAPMHEWMAPHGCGFTLNVIPSVWGNVAKAEYYAEVPLRPMTHEDDDDHVNWDEPIDPEEFKGFYDPEEETKA